MHLTSFVESGTMAFDTEILQPDDAGIASAARRLRKGDLVAFATETVYGLGADARNGTAVANIFQAKDRPTFNPLIVHVANMDAVREIVDLPDILEKAGDAFWPGPLTLLAPIRSGAHISDLVTAGMSNLAIRVPAHPSAQALLDAFDGPIAAPSANRSGRISPTIASDVMIELGGRISAIVDGGPCAVGLESTIIGIEDDHPVLLRPGGIAIEALTDLFGHALMTPHNCGIQAPGQLRSHYAPDCAIRLDVNQPRSDELFIRFGSGQMHEYCIDLSQTGDLVEAAANLFNSLRRADQKAQELGLRGIAVTPIPDKGLGVAINDRLRRAAAPRD